MKKTIVVTSRVVVALTVLAFFSSGCDLLDAIIRGLEHYCATPEFVVTRTDDPAGGGLCTADSCSLRQAVQTSNGCPGTQTIRVSAGTYLLSLAGADEDANRTGDIDITDSVIINGEAGTVIDGGGLDRVFDIFAPAEAALTSLTITHGSSVDGGGIRNAGTLTMQGGVLQDNQGRRGGGLFSSGTATLNSVTVQDNLVDRGTGGGIHNEGELTITLGSILGNSAPQGGGLYNADTAELVSTSINANNPHSGPGGTTSGVSGGGVYNIGTLTMSAGEVRSNRADLFGAGIANEIATTLRVTSVTIADNLLGTAADAFGMPVSEGAGLYNAGSATLEASVLSGNQADGSRGGAIANAGGSLTVTDTTLEANSALQGAGLFNAGTANVQGSTFSNNAVTGGGGVAGLGAGIDNLYRASLTLTNSTLSGNRINGSGDFLLGAGLYNEGVAQLSNVTVTANVPNGLYSSQPGIEGELEGPPVAKLSDTLIAGNLGSDCSGTTLLSQGHNLDGDNTCELTGPGDLSGRDPRLGPLASNGGPTQTHALLPGSPAIDAGDFCPMTDQRGFPRPLPAGGACDIGAYEYDPANTNAPQSTATPVPSAAPASPTFTFTQEANCRQGPNTLYPAMGFGHTGEQALIEGLSDPPGWYYVTLPDGFTHCFVAGSTGTVAGPVDGLRVIPAPPVPVPPAAPELAVSNQICDAKQYVVHLSWNDVQGETGYHVYRDGQLIGDLGAGAVAYDDVPPDYKPHEYYVEAFNDFGAAASGVRKSEGCLY